MFSRLLFDCIKWCLVSHSFRVPEKESVSGSTAGKNFDKLRGIYLEEEGELFVKAERHMHSMILLRFD
jgi:hypothetical protein